MGTIIKNKLTPKELGDSKAILGAPADTKRLLLGTVFGIATGISKKSVPDPTAETGQKEFEGLSGEFEGVPADASRDTVQSGTLYLPVIHQQIAGMFKRDNPPASVQFACEVYTMRDSNKAGYTVVAEPVTSLTEADPLAAIKKAVADHRAKNPKELPKPAAVAAAGRK